MLRAQRLKVGPQWIRYRSQESPKSATVLRIVPSGGRVCKHHHLVPSMTNQSNLQHPGTTACARSCAEAPPPAHCCFLVSFFPLSVFFLMLRIPFASRLLLTVLLYLGALYRLELAWITSIYATQRRPRAFPTQEPSGTNLGRYIYLQVLRTKYSYQKRNKSLHLPVRDTVPF